MRPFVGGAWAHLLPLALLPAAGFILFSHHRSLRAGILLGSVCVGILLGILSLARMADSLVGSFLSVAEKDVSSFSASVTEDSSLSEKGYSVVRLSLRTATSSRCSVAGQASGSVLLFVPGDFRFSIGQRLDIASALSTLTDANATDRYVSRAERRDLRVLGYTGPAWELRARAREWLHRSLSLAGYPSSALLEALLVGGREDVPEDLYDGFKHTGSLHILALSGMHVTVLYGIAGGLLFFLRGRRAKFVVASCVLLLYQFIAGFMPSLLRATVMIMIGGVGVLADRDREPMNLLSIAGLALVLLDPFQVYSLSFQLSFLAIAGMLTLGSLAERLFAGRLPSKLLVPLSFSLGAQGATLPLIVGQFGAYYPSGIIAGLILVPLTTGFLWAGLVWLPLSVIPWPVLHSLCARGFAMFYDMIKGTAGFFSGFPAVVFAPSSAHVIIPLCTASAVIIAGLLPLRRRALPAHSA